MFGNNDPMIGPNPGQIRLRHLLLLPFYGYGALNVVTFIMVAAGAPGKFDPFWHAPLWLLFGS